jgi:hypothetical protein
MEENIVKENILLDYEEVKKMPKSKAGYIPVV